MSKQKTNPNKLQLTQADMKKAEAKWKKQLEEMKLEATSNASLLTQCVMLLALKNKFNFYADEVATLMEEVEDIYHKLGDKSTGYELKDVQKELESINVFITEDWK